MPGIAEVWRRCRAHVGLSRVLLDGLLDGLTDWLTGGLADALSGPSAVDKHDKQRTTGNPGCACPGKGGLACIPRPAFTA